MVWESDWNIFFSQLKSWNVDCDHISVWILWSLDTASQEASQCWRTWNACMDHTLGCNDFDSWDQVFQLHSSCWVIHQIYDLQRTLVSKGWWRDWNFSMAVFMSQIYKSWRYSVFSPWTLRQYRKSEVITKCMYIIMLQLAAWCLLE